MVNVYPPAAEAGKGSFLGTAGSFPGEETPPLYGGKFSFYFVDLATCDENPTTEAEHAVASSYDALEALLESIAKGEVKTPP